MRIKLSFSKFFTPLLSLIFFAGIQNIMTAQVQVTNFTGCPITVYVGQHDLNTPVPCDICPSNPWFGTATIIPNGQTADIYGQDVCFEEAGWIAWQVNGAGAFGLSANPGLFAACVPNIPGAPCSFPPTNAFWTTTGSGYVSAIIF